MKVSRSNSMTYGIPMEYVREMKFVTELAPCNYPNIRRGSDFVRFLTRYMIVISETTKSI